MKQLQKQNYRNGLLQVSRQGYFKGGKMFSNHPFHKYRQ